MVSAGATKLYLIGSADLLRSLKRGVLPLQTAQQHGNPWLLQEPKSHKQQALSQDQWLAILHDRYQAIPEHLRVAVDFTYFTRQMEPKRAAIEAEYHAQGGHHDGAERLDVKRHQALVALTLTESVQNPLAWQYWGHGHTGIALELNAQHSGFQSAAGQPRLLRHVRYVARRTLSSSEQQPFPGWFEAPVEMSALREWRLVLPLTQAKHEQQGPCLPIQRGMITGLHLGCMATASVNEETANLIKRDQRYRGIALYRLTTEQHQFSLHGMT